MSRLVPLIVSTFALCSVLAAPGCAAGTSPAGAAGMADASTDRSARWGGASEDTTSLDEVEIADLQWMREEEKLARDVYRVLGDIWQDRTFERIGDSEQAHTDAVLALLERYGVEDPVTDDTVGTFTDPTLQELFDALVERGEVSLVEALTVGANIEELDMVDIADAIAATDEEPIQETYGRLLDGSEDHLRAFVGRLERLGADYAPAYLDEVTFEQVLAEE